MEEEKKGKPRLKLFFLIFNDKKGVTRINFEDIMLRALSQGQKERHCRLLGT